jgi:hypothetical protein
MALSLRSSRPVVNDDNSRVSRRNNGILWLRDTELEPPPSRIAHWPPSRCPSHPAMQSLMPRSSLHLCSSDLVHELVAFSTHPKRVEGGGPRPSLPKHFARNHLTSVSTLASHGIMGDAPRDEGELAAALYICSESLSCRLHTHPSLASISPTQVVELTVAGVAMHFFFVRIPPGSDSGVQRPHADGNSWCDYKLHHLHTPLHHLGSTSEIRLPHPRTAVRRAQT